MPFLGAVIPAITGAIGAAAPAIGGALGGASGIGSLAGSIAGKVIPGVLSTTGDILNNTVGARTGTANPNIAPAYQNLAQLLNARATQRLMQGTDLSGYTANGIGNINSTYGGVGQQLNNNLSARGLATSPVAAAVDQKLAASRAGDIAQFRNSIPLLQNQLEQQNMQNALQQIAALGRGTTTVNPGSATGAGFSSAGELLSYLNGKNGINPFGTAIPIINNNRTDVLGTMQPMPIPQDF